MSDEREERCLLIFKVHKRQGIHRQADNSLGEILSYLFENSLIILLVKTNNDLVRFYPIIKKCQKSQDLESWDMNTKEKIEAAGKKKEEGNGFFKVGKYAKTSKRYEKATKYIEHDTSLGEEENMATKALI
ncbi:hypothetical protein LguiA_006718 [Lonicera macranthoides]